MSLLRDIDQLADLIERNLNAKKASDATPDQMAPDTPSRSTEAATPAADCADDADTPQPHAPG